MKIILSKNTDPYTNLATEEVLLKNFTDDIVFLYINSKSIIIGKHQNALAEINYKIVTENNIPVLRRLSGGGTVFHDPGNINYCFITSGAKGELVNFDKYMTPIVNFLNSIDVNAKLGGRHDILIEGSKISGNACHVFKSRVMHHGTLLFNSQLSTLTSALKNDPIKFKDKAVKSIRSKVSNIQEHLNQKISVENFISQLSEYIISHNNCEPYELNNNDYTLIDDLVKTKFSTWEWNYGYSPKYEFKKRIKATSGRRYEIRLKVIKGQIVEVKINSNARHKDKLNDLQQSITNCLHQRDAIKENTNDVFNDWDELSQEEFLLALF
ncbi:lipoate-protein ligase A [Saccharicrinis carchari]|uniref:lipoate--protein ligase n=1 Tax=Saccharicrinis carchari TaxID=1168039 RepID=A0A521CGY6_SACCC|nr:lipoate--protein ligase [Saccharicrinis carchari]SMO58688.1 lipoate-protein ligase A [Saccharicrinis carchari]